MNRPPVALLLCLYLLQACGGGGDGSGSPQTPAPTPTPTPTPTLTPPPVPPTTAARLRAAMALGAARVVDDLGIIVSNSAASVFPTGVLIEPDDARIRYLGGVAIRGTTFPYRLAILGQAVTNGDPTILSGTGLPASRSGINNGYEFTLPAGSNTFEVSNLRAGFNSPIQIEIDGISSSDAGYDNGFALVGDGNIIYTGVTLPQSLVARKIKILTSWRPFLGIRLPTGNDIGPAPQRIAPISVVFQGDSITTGSVAGHSVLSWIMQASYRLGIDNPINIGVGSSGYLRKLPITTGYNFRERLGDVVKAVNGGPPDVVVVAGGINDCSVAPGGPYTAAETGAEALAYFQAIRTAAPETLIFVLGPFTDWNNATYSQTSRDCRDAIFASAAQMSKTYTIDVADWVTLANRDTVFSGTTNGPHPTNAGHAIYGERFAAAFAGIINGLP